MTLLDRLRGPAALVTWSAAFVAGRPAAALPGLRVAWEVGRRVRRAPILRPDPALLVRDDDATFVPVCSLISDTHVTADATAPAELAIDPGQWPWARHPTGDELAAGLARALADIRTRGARTVIWCGDEVDTGRDEEWRRLRAIAARFPELAHRMVPGNHDICFNRPYEHDYDLARRALREEVFRAHVGPLAEFPLVDPIVGAAGPVTTILLDSCRHQSRYVLSNAIGMFGDDQLDRLADALARCRGPVLIVAHHHVWRDARFAQPDAWFNTAVDADRAIAIAGAYRRRAPDNHVLVCHGHRHALTAGHVGEPDAPIAIVGLPSTTLGDKSRDGRLDGIVRYATAGLRADRSWGVALHAVGPLIDTAMLPASARAPQTPPDRSLRALAILP